MLILLHAMAIILFIYHKYEVLFYLFFLINFFLSTALCFDRVSLENKWCKCFTRITQQLHLIHVRLLTKKLGA